MISNRYSPDCFGQLLHAHVVDDQQVRLEVPGQHLVLARQGFVVQEVADHVEDRAVQHDEALLDGLVAEGLGQEALADARRPDQQHVAGLADEAAGGQVEDLLRLIDGLNDQSKSSSGFSSRKLGRLDAALDLPLLADQQLVLQDQLQELGMVELVAGGFLQADVRATGPGPTAAVGAGSDCKRSFIRVLLVKGGRGNYGGIVWRNGVGLCRGATRRGIAGPGRKQVRRRLEAWRLAARAVFVSGSLLLSSHASQNLRPRRGDPPGDGSPGRRLAA